MLIPFLIYGVFIILYTALSSISLMGENFHFNKALMKPSRVRTSGKNFPQTSFWLYRFKHLVPSPFFHILNQILTLALNLHIIKWGASMKGAAGVLREPVHSGSQEMTVSLPRIWGRHLLNIGIMKN